MQPLYSLYNFHRRLLLLLLLLLPAHATLAAAGKALFVAGEVRVERTNAPAPGLPLAQDDTLFNGDIVVTGAASRAQLLMADGARIALRADSRYQLDELRLPAAVGTPGQARAVDADGRSVATLLKGGFRTRTGSIGKQDPAAYEVRTPVGVLGIRGTEYVAVLCQAGDCSAAPGVRPGELVRDGLYLGVFSNGIVFRAPGQPPRELGPGEFLLIPLDEPGVEVLPAAPSFLLEDDHGSLELPGGPREVAPPREIGPQEMENIGTRRAPAGEGPGTGMDRDGAAPELPVGGTGPDGEPVDLTPGLLPPRSGTPPQRRDIAIAIGQFGQFPLLAVVQDNQPTDYVLDTTLNLVRLVAPLPVVDSAPRSGSYALGTAQVAGGSGDPATLLRWGRWSGGIAQVTDDLGNTSPLDVQQASLHWVMSPNADNPPVMPQAGSASYSLVGATTPTSNAGQAGTLGAATFNADFTNQQVQSTISLQMGDNSWEAVGGGSIGVQTGLPPHQFRGFYESVQITGPNNDTGFGEFSGFFSGPGASPQLPDLPGGAGLSYSLSNSDLIETIQGVLIFQSPVD